MTPDTERWRQIEDVLDRVFQANPDEVQALITQLTEGDTDLRREVDALLSADASVERFLEDDAPAFAAPFVTPLPGDDLSDDIPC